MSTDPAAPGRGFQDRPAAGLYVAGWVFSGLGLGALLIGVMTDPPWRGILVMAALLALLLGLGAACGYQIITRRSRPAERFRGPAPLLLFGFQFVLVNAVSLVLLTLGVPLADLPSPLGFFAATVVLLLGYTTVIWLFGVRADALTWRDMGLLTHLGTGRMLADIGIGAGVMLGVALVAGILGGLLARFLGVEAPGVVPAPTTTVDIALLALGAGLLVPIGEELFFRGYTLTAWWRDLGPRAALWRTTVFFALAHIATLESATFSEGVRQAILVLAVIGPVGFVLGWLFIRRGLIAAIAGHAAFNLFGVLILVLRDYLPTPPGVG